MVFWRKMPSHTSADSTEAAPELAPHGSRGEGAYAEGKQKGRRTHTHMVDADGGTAMVELSLIHI